MTEGMSLFIIVFTLVNIAACVWLMWWTARSRVGGGAAGTAEPDTTGHVWDGDLQEFNNPLPRWWLWLFIITIVFGLIYLAIYPGLGNFAGSKRWTQVEQYAAQRATLQAKFEQSVAPYAAMPLPQLSQDANAMAIARNLFGANCSTCHGSDARGAKGFPNLTDNDWLWGGDPDSVHATISAGRHGVMPALGSALGDEGVKEVAAYVVSLSGGNAPQDWIAAGRTRFDTLCVACHGADGKGNPLLGAPNLTDRIWLHGGDFETITATVTNGRDNQMPAHLPLVGETKVKLLAAYVLSLSANAAQGGSGSDAGD